MNDSSDSSAQGTRWLLFIPQLPPKPDYLRVKLRRRLQKLGAVAVRSSVHVLPPGDEALEDLQWLRGEVRADGGEAVVCEARLVAGLTDAEVEALFRADRDARYAEVAAEARALLEAEAGRAELEAAHARLRRRLDEVAAIDFFEAPGRADAEHALRAVHAHLSGGGEMPTIASEAGADRVRPGTTWVTRRGVKVDRMSSAWLIRRFLDPAAAFRFVAPGEPVAPGELRFDMFEGEYTHEGERCTFETLLARFGHDGDPALRAIAEVVHDIDVKDARFGRAETPGVAAVFEAIAAANPTDEARVESASLMLDGLYEVFRRERG